MGSDCPAVLTNEQLRPFLEGELNEFGPSRVPLVWGPTENFLTRKKNDAPAPAAQPDPPAQGELF